MQVCTIVRGKTLKTMYRSKDAEAAEMALEDFAANPWGQKYPAIAQSCRRNWEREIPFPFRRLSGGHYTTNAIEALNAKLRRAVRTRGHFPNEFAATKYLFLVPVSRLAPGRRRVENVAERAVRGKDSIRYYVRRTVGSSVMAQRAPYTRFLTLPPRSVAGAT